MSDAYIFSQVERRSQDKDKNTIAAAPEASSSNATLNAGLTVLTSISHAFTRRRTDSESVSSKDRADDGAEAGSNLAKSDMGSSSRSPSNVFKGLKAREATKAWSVLRRSVGLPINGTKTLEYVSSPRIPLSSGSGGDAGAGSFTSSTLPSQLRVGDMEALHRLYLSKVVQSSLWTIEPQEMSAFTLKEQDEALSLAHIPFSNLRIRDIQKIESFCR